MTKDNIPENAEIGDCPDTLKEGESCNLKCKDGYKITGRQPMCFKSYFDIESFKCVKEIEEDNEKCANTEKFDEPPIEGGEWLKLMKKQKGLVLKKSLRLQVK